MCCISELLAFIFEQAFILNKDSIIFCLSSLKKKRQELIHGFGLSDIALQQEQR